MFRGAPGPWAPEGIDPLVQSCLRLPVGPPRAASGAPRRPQGVPRPDITASRPADCPGHLQDALRGPHE
eukprot:5062134-Pyramimonas_sp.AAC.1